MKPNTEPVTVAVMDGDKEAFRKTYIPICPEYADALTQVYPYELDKDQHLILFVPRDGYRDRVDGGKHQRKPLMCGFNATEDYLQAIHGVKLHHADKTWYEDHPLTVPDGLPMGATLRVIQELVEPYGMRISRVRVIPGTSIPQAVAVWQKTLGVNPLALADRSTTNREFAEMAGMDLREADEAFRFEFGSEPLRPSIMCASGLQSTTTTATGWMGGHASYLSPRMMAGMVDMSIQLSRLCFDPWSEAGPPEYEALQAKAPPPDNKLPDIYQMWMTLPIEIRDGLNQPFKYDFDVRPLREKIPAFTSGSGGYGTAMLPSKSDPQRYGGHTVRDGEPVPKDHCRACGDKIFKDVPGAELSGPFCLQCWVCMFLNVKCPGKLADGEDCGVPWTEWFPSYRGFDRAKREIHMRCPMCEKEYFLSAAPNRSEKYERLMFVALSYNLTYPERTEFLALRNHVTEILDKESVAMSELAEATNDGRKGKDQLAVSKDKQTKLLGAGASKPVH